MLKRTANTIKKLIGKINPVRKRISPLSVTALSVSLFLIITSAVFSAKNLDFGYKINCDGEDVGITEKRRIAKEIISDAKEELKNIPTAKEAEKISVSLTVAKREYFSDDKSLKDSIIACYDGKTACFGIFADGRQIASVATKSDAVTALDSYKKEFLDKNTKTAYFNKKVEILPVREVKENISLPSSLGEIFKKKTSDKMIYTAPNDEKIEEIAKKLNVSEENLRSLNQDKDLSVIKKGDTINYEKIDSTLGVITSSEITNKETISFNINKIDDAEAYEGTTTVVTAGITGEKEVKYRVISENGVESSRKVLEENITKEPIPETIKVGTRPRPKTATTGTFMTPYHGILTSRYGSYRSRGIPHTGVDLAGPEGSDIQAADGGTVTHVGYKGSYGNLIIIKHDNGYETYYAHLSGFKVSNGQRVEKGEVIGLLGNTGNSTGPHLHFEVRQNGQNVNPAQFIAVEGE